MNFPNFMKRIMCKKFMKFVNIAHKHECHPEEATEEIMNMALVKFIGGKDAKKYRGMIDSMIPILMYLTEESIKNICETCYGNDLPRFDEEFQKQLSFFFGGKEPAKMMRRKLMKYYPSSKFPIQKKGTHGGLQTANPEEYSKMLIDSIQE